MNSRLLARRLPLLALASLATLVALAPAAAAQSDTPKTIVLGFDGMDHDLAAQFMADGDMPNLARLAEQGTFTPLHTSNPAQSPVSWAVFNTGSNPGKTGVAGFVSRSMSSTDDNGIPIPQPMLGFPATVPAEDYADLPLGMESGNSFAAVVGIGGFLVVLIVLKALFKASFGVAAVVALLAGGGLGWMAREKAAALPAGELPYVINPMQGTNFWAHLEDAGVRIMGVQIPSTYPPDDEGDHVQLLSGLGVPDIGGSPGSWFVYTDDTWTLSDKSTDTAGKIIKVFEEGAEPGRLQAALLGPSNWVVKGEFERRIEGLEELEEDPNLSTAEAADLDAQIAEVKAELKQWEQRNNKGKTSVPFTMVVDRDAGEVTFELPDRSLTVATGDWSPLTPVSFEFDAHRAAHGLVRFHVLQCDEEQVRVFVPPISIDPSAPPEHLPICAPAGFSRELADATGPYETLGWACITNPLKDFKDSGLSPQSFLEDIDNTMKSREAILEVGLRRQSEWDIYFQVFSTLDRVCHMLMREADPEHPEHDAEYASQAMEAYGRTFPLSSAVHEVYVEMDRIVGGVLDRIEDGEFGENALLLIVSDHGFTSFRRGVNLNNLLHELGFMVFRGEKSVSEVLGGGGMKDLLGFVDWSRTRAYSYGLGKVFINLQGREPQGIVPPEEYDAIVAEIQAALAEVVDPQTGAKVVTSAHSKHELFSGPWVDEGEATWRYAGGRTKTDYQWGFADIFLGYAPYYRVSWANTMGGLDPEAIVDNTNHWSGGHVSVDPEHVAGVLLSNEPMTGGARADLMDIAPTLLQRYGVDPSATDMDGEVLPLEGV